MTGKVVMVGIEESQRVKRGQVIARVDDTNANAKASVTQASAREDCSDYGPLPMVLTVAGRQQLVIQREHDRLSA
jgi:multidrug efflux pump subunit AcrA (membrane-fusion protein)